jgi:hypothetical protein
VTHDIVAVYRLADPVPPLDAPAVTS